MLNDRLGLEVTFYNKITKNLILQVPQPPSVGFTENPYENIGKVLNRGIEVSGRGQVLQRDNVAWEVRGGFATLKNEVLDLGEVAAFNTIRFATVNRVTEGQQVGAFFSHRVRSVNEAGTAVVSDTLEFMGNLLPTFEANVSSTLTLFKAIRVYAQLDTKQDFMLYNATAVYRERNFQVAENWIRRMDVLTPEERARRFGPYVTESGAAIGAGSVNEEYIEPADFIRLNEVSLTYTLPDHLAERFFRTGGASITLSGRNLAVWSDYSGFSPDIQNEFDAVAGRADFFTLPPARRLGLRLDLSF
jgi:TonB-dependent starch-binding outer membrane protein SusC